MKTEDLLLLESPALDGRDEIYYIAFMKAGKVKFLREQESKILKEMEPLCVAIYKYSYWQVSAKVVDGKDVEITENERSAVSKVDKSYRNLRLNISNFKEYILRNYEH